MRTLLLTLLALCMAASSLMAAGPFPEEKLSTRKVKLDTEKLSTHKINTHQPLSTHKVRGLEKLSTRKVKGLEKLSAHKISVDSLSAHRVRVPQEKPGGQFPTPEDK